MLADLYQPGRNILQGTAAKYRSNYSRIHDCEELFAEGRNHTSQKVSRRTGIINFASVDGFHGRAHEPDMYTRDFLIVSLTDVE